jgi:hypothetical protein
MSNDDDGAVAAGEVEDKSAMGDLYALSDVAGNELECVNWAYQGLCLAPLVKKRSPHTSLVRANPLTPPLRQVSFELQGSRAVGRADLEGTVLR